jgi:hypothetical protein
VDKTKIVYVKKDGKISLALREALAECVSSHGTSFAKAYDSVLSAWGVMEKITNTKIEGEVVNKDSKTHAAISSVDIKGRLAQYVAAWEMAAVVSADGREDRGPGLGWRKDDRESTVKQQGPFADSFIRGHDGNLVKGLKKQEKDTLSAMFDENGLDKCHGVRAWWQTSHFGTGVGGVLLARYVR